MIPNRSNWIVCLLTLAGATQMQAADILKANNTDPLDLPTSWVGGVVPGAADVAVWDATVLAANTTTLFVDTSWQGLKLLTPGGTVTISNGSTLTLGAAGIDASLAGQNLTIAANVALGVNQTWTVGALRTLTVEGVFSNNAKTLTLANAGSVHLRNGFMNGAADWIKSGAGFVGLGGTGTGVSVALGAGKTIDLQAGSISNELGSINNWASNLSSLNLATGTTFDCGDTAVVVDALTGTGTVQKAGTGNATMTIGVNNSSATHSGVVRRLDGVFTLSKSGNGTQTLSGGSGTNNNNLLVEVKAGTLVLSKTSSGTTGVGTRAAYGVADIASGATLQLAGSGNEQIFGHPVTGVPGTGSVVMSGGTLDFNGRNEGWNILSGSGTIRNNAAATTSLMTVGLTSNGSGTFSGAIIDGVSTGIMALTKNGTGTLTLTGTNNTYTGATTVSRGVLEVAGSIVNSAIAVNVNGTIAGEGVVGNVTFGAGSPAPGVLANPSTPGSLSMAAVTVNGTVNVSTTNANFVSGVPFPVFTYTSKGNAWTAANFSLLNSGNYRSFNFTDTANTVRVSIGSTSIEWNNFSANSTWDTNLSVNFQDGTPSNTKCYYYDSIIFGNLPGANQAVVINGPQFPSSLMVNSSFDYTFTNGTLGSISGPTGLIKSGTGTLLMSLSNAYTGGTTITGGTLAITSDTALGAVPNAFQSGSIMLNGGALRLDGAFQLNGNRGLMLGAAGGTLDTATAGTTLLIDVSTLIEGNGPLHLRANGDLNDAASGAGAVVLSAANPFVGKVTVSSGLVVMDSDFGDPANSVVLNGGGLVDQLGNSVFSRNLEVGAAGGVLRVNTTSTNTVISSDIVNSSGVVSTVLRHTQGGILKLAGSGAGYAGTFTNARGATHITAVDANWQNTDFSIDTLSATSALIFNGTGTAKAKSITSTRDVLLDNGTRLDVGALTLSTNAHAVRTITGTLGSLTSSTGTLTITNGIATGDMTTLDQQIQVPIKDFDGATPLTLVKNNNNILTLTQPNTHTGGTTVQLGRIHAATPQCFGTGMVTINSGGQTYLTAAASSVYANDFTISGIGVTEAAGNLGAIRFVNNAIGGSVTVAAAGARIVGYATNAGQILGGLRGSGNLQVNSTFNTNYNGVITISGDSSTYSGTITVSQGTLTMNSPSLNGSLVVNNGAIYNGESTYAGDITLGAGGASTLAFNPATPGSLSATGSLQVNGTVTVGLGGSIPASGTYKIIGFGAKSGAWTAANFVLGSTFRPGSLVTENANDVSVALNKLALTWTNGAGTSIWDSNGALNFRDTVPVAQRFYTGDDVTFDNVPNAAQTITINGNQQPSSITVNSTFAYTFNAGTAGSISGGATLLKSGSGLLSINLANTFTGGITISQGDVRTGNNTAAGSGTITLGDGNTGASNVSWLFNGSGTPANPVVVPALGTGTVTIGTYSAGTFTVASGALTLNRPVIIQDGTADRTSFSGKISGNVGTITLTGNRVTFDNAQNDFVGNIVVSANTIYQNNVANAVPDTTNFTLLGSGSRFRLAANSEVIGSIGGDGIIDNITGSGNTLTVGGGNGSATFAGSITNGSGILNLTKTGTGTQVFSGATSYTGSTTVSGGTLQLPSSPTATGACTVADAATLIITGSPGSTWSCAGMTLGTATGATLKILNFGSSLTAAPIAVTSNTLTANGTISLEVTGTFEVGQYPLISLPAASAIGGTGFSAFVLAPLPAGVVATLVDGGDTIILDVSVADKLVWQGNVNSLWDINTTNNWVLGAIAKPYLQGDDVRFTDAASGSTNVVLNTPVSPNGVLFSNDSKVYSLSGSGAITGNTTVVKNGGAAVIFTNANTYLGTTTVNGGTLQLGDGISNGSITGSLANSAVVIFHPASEQTYAGAISGSAGSIEKNGPQKLILTGPNLFSGETKINQGTLQLGNGSVNGTVAAGLYNVAAGTVLRIDQASLGNAAITGDGWTTRLRGAGTVRLRVAGAWPANNWGPNAALTNVFHPGFTGTLHLELGRTDVSPANFGGVSTVVVDAGAQFLGWSGTYPQAWVLSGDGAGEAGFPGALRVAGGGTVATYAGPITLAGDASLTSQDANSIMTCSGVISGAFNLWKTSNAGLLVFSGANTFSGTMDNFGGILRLDHAFALQNSTLIGSAGTVQFGGAVAGNEFTFGGLAGTRSLALANTNGVAIALRVGNNGSARTYSGTLSGAGSLTKIGTGTFTLASAQSYTGGTSVNAGTLLVNNASGEGTGSGAVTVNSTGVLGGTGFITGAVTVNAGATLAPGSPVESLATGPLTLATGSTYAVEINSSGTPAADVTNAGGNISLAGSLVVSDIASVPVALPLGTKFTILSYAGTRSGTFAGLAESATIAVGVNTFRIRYADGNAVTLEAVAGTTTYASWVAGFGLTGNAALANSDPDFDGIANAIEYVIGGNPATVQDQALLPTITLMTNPGGTVPNGEYVRFRYRRTAASASLNPRVEIDADLIAPWTNTTGAGGVVQEVATGFYTSPTPADRVDVFIPRALYEAQGKLFCRLAVTVP